MHRHGHPNIYGYVWTPKRRRILGALRNGALLTIPSSQLWYKRKVKLTLASVCI